ncbi:MAG TPA: bifunctional (p)ppGpp synthetase/guanosine-3',5'-bis(diphosphate) 3'-pyrophosphohydrolase [Acetobacteraceae bacterium]|nr:bifunctional (p)ppGpp synthetase/guanosine-3',5'-bis(diphosphate) 3'-pyrophosphohydrolase [Acetobacteraceae bacterium]
MKATTPPSLPRAPEGLALRAAPSRPVALTDKIKSYAPNAETGLVDEAYGVAYQAHGAQKRDNGDPYITHPLAVADILAGYRLDVPSICTALLHDTVEDTGITLAQIERQFGGTVAGLVDGVTKLTRLELQSDRTKQAENFRKLVLAMSRDIRVLLVKLADRLHNMRTLDFVTNADRRKRIARETMDIYAPLAARIGMDAMKTELQTRAFAILDPEGYNSIQARLNYLRGQGADVIEEVRRELAQVCRDGGVEVLEVSGREKSAFSIWEKMQRRNIAFEQLSDIMAFRIVVPTREECYAALGAIHAAYPVIAGRFKDYISTPKANGYRSLHTGVTLRHPRNQKIEIQIRTRAMHDVADNGVAAHWNYKEGERVDPEELERFRWVQDLLEILDNSAAPDEFLENTKLELYQDQVFCFTPKGQLIQLPRGATPIDFAYAVHSQVGDTCVGAKVNGRLTPLRYELQNGDQVEIMTARGGTPSPSWERWVVTGKARSRIRRYVAQQQRAQTLDQGRAALARAFRQDGLDGSEKVLESALKTLKCPSVDDLYVAVGSGNIGPKDVIHAAYPEMKAAARGPRHMPSMLTRHGTAKPPSRESGMAVTGLVPGMAVHYAGCCHPLPGDRIVGIVSTGKGVTLHTHDCPTLETFAATPERFIDVDWDYATLRSGGSGHTGRISVIAANEPSTLGDMANAVSRQDGSVSNMKITNRQQDFMEVLVDVDVRDARHLSNVIAGLRAVRGITQVERAQG